VIKIEMLLLYVVNKKLSYFL